MPGRLSYPGLVAGDVDSVASAALRELTGISGVRRSGIALVEGGGRRLRFRADGDDDWCHIDAYDDVPLTAVVRTGEPMLGSLDDLGTRYAGFVERQRGEGTRALAVLPLRGADSPIGGLLLYYEADQPFDEGQRRRLAETAQRIAEAVRRVRSAAARASAPPGESDSRHRATLRLEDDARAVARARHFLRGLLAAWGVDEDVLDTAELCLSELVTNAVIHAGTDSVITVSLESGVLRVEVHDYGSGGEEVEVVDDEDPLRVFGRGLQLVDALADRWGSDQGVNGTTSWFALGVA